jgi:hypothetical protein
MPDKNESLFTEEDLQRGIWEGLTGNKQRQLSIAYVGSDLLEGRMDAILLADGLKGTARFINRVGEIHLGTSSDFLWKLRANPEQDHSRFSSAFPMH